MKERRRGKKGLLGVYAKTCAMGWARERVSDKCAFVDYVGMCVVRRTETI